MWIVIGTVLYVFLTFYRSATLTLAYLMSCYHMPLRTACVMLRSSRSIVSPNESFLHQLIQRERTIVQAHNDNDNNTSNNDKDSEYISSIPQSMLKHPNMSSIVFGCDAELVISTDHKPLLIHHDTGLLWHVNGDIKYVVGWKSNNDVIWFTDAT